MKKHLFIALFLLFSGLVVSAQQKIKDGSLPGNNLPNKDAALELESANRGLLITRIALKSTTEAIPLSAHVAGMIVYNTVTVNDVIPGVYYNDGNKWIFSRAFQETLTTLVGNGDGTYTYTNEKSEKSVIDITGVVKKNIQNILDDKAVKDALQKLTDQNAGSIKYDDATKNFTYVDAAGKSQSMKLTDLVKSNETLTTISQDNTKGTFTYVDEKSKATVIDISGLVKGNIQNILDDKAVKDALQKLTDQNAGSIKYDDATKNFTYVDAAGKSQSMKLTDLVKSNETLTTISQDLIAGTITYTDENSKPTILNIKQAALGQPWNKTNTNTAATLNTDDIYAGGNVEINKDLMIKGSIGVVGLEAAGPDDESVAWNYTSHKFKRIEKSTPIRQVWGLIKLPMDGEKIAFGTTLKAENPGSNNWVANYLNDGTVLITLTNAFSSLPVANVSQYLVGHNVADPVTDIKDYGRQDTRDNCGVDYLSRNKIQIWVCNDVGERSNSWINGAKGARYLSFFIVGY